MPSLIDPVRRARYDLACNNLKGMVVAKEVNIFLTRERFKNIREVNIFLTRETFKNIREVNVRAM